MVRKFTVHYIGQRGARPAAPVDLSARAVQLNHWTDTGSGEVSSCSIMLNGEGGAFMSEANSGATPLLDQYDELLVAVGVGAETQSRVFYVDRLLPQRSAAGLVLTVECLGREAYLQRQFVTGSYRNDRWSDIILGVCAGYVNGSRQPAVACDVLEVPAHALGSVDFGNGDVSVYDALMRCLGELNAPVSAGGVGDVLSLTFTDTPPATGEGPAQYDRVSMAIRSQGSRNSVALRTNEPSLNIDAGDPGLVSCSKVLESEEANVVRVRGQQDFGTVPREFGEWRSALETVDSYPMFAAGRYPAGARVRYRGRAWERRDRLHASVLEPGNLDVWDEVTLSTVLGSGFDYSPWTKGQATAWQAMASNPSRNRAESFDSPAYPDGNMAVRDDGLLRVWVDAGPETSTRFRRTEGRRYLFAQSYTILHPTASRDAFGNQLRGSVAEIVNGEPVVVLSGAPEVPTAGAETVAAGAQVAVRETGRIWEWTKSTSTAELGGYRAARNARNAQPAGTFAWRDVTASTYGNDCFHRPEHIRNVQGYFGRNRGGTWADGSAVEIVYEVDLTLADLGVLRALGVVGTLISALTGPQQVTLGDWRWGSLGWWATLFTAPHPVAGSPWDGFTGVMDMANSNLPLSGYGENYGPTTGIAFALNFEVQIGGARVPFQGDYPFKIFVYDSHGTVWVKDENVRFQGDTQMIRAFWSEFRVYRARTPLSVNDFISNVTLPERLELEELNPRRVRLITVQYDGPYDEVGRYSPWTNLGVVGPLLAATATATSLRHVGRVDGLHFMRDPTARARDAFHSHRTVDRPSLDRPQVSNQQQLGRVASAELDVALHRTAAYSITMEGRTSISVDDTIRYRDTLLEPDPNPLSLPPLDHRAQLVVTKVRHSVTPDGGWTTHVDAVDRIGD